MANYVEFDAVKNHAPELSALGTKALIVTGRSSARKCGALDDVAGVLESAGIPYEIFDSVEENPSIETVMAARDKGIASGADFVIGIGGGSPMDAAKAVAVMIKNSSSDWDLLYENEQAGGVPVACIPTTCGTGSEVTAVSVLTRHDLKTKLTAKQKLFPDLSLVDPVYLDKAPLSIIRSTSIDAMGHMLESFINTKSTEQSRACALEGLRVWSRVKHYIENGLPEDTAARREVLMDLALSSNLGGLSIVTPGTSLPHGMSYVLTYEKHVPHGIAIGIFQTGYLDQAAENDKQLLLDAMGFEDMSGFREFIRRTCIGPMFNSYMTREEFSDIMQSSAVTFLNNPARMEKIPYPMDEKVMQKILKEIQ